MKKDDLLMKTESKDSRWWNTGMAEVFIYGVLVMFVGTLALVVSCIPHGDITGLMFFLCLIGLGVGMLLYGPFGQEKFRKIYFEIQEDKFSLIRVDLLDLLKKKRNFTPFSSVRRV